VERLLSGAVLACATRFSGASGGCCSLFSMAERPRHADVLASRDRAEPDAPRQPGGTGVKPIAPTLAGVELADEIEQPRRRGVEMSRQLGDLVAKPLELERSAAMR
jgi:hypothetical protein